MSQAHPDLARRHIWWEIRTAYFGVLDRRTFHVQMPQIATSQIRIPQIGVSDDQMAQVDPAEIDASQVAATKINDLTAFNTLVKPIHISDSQRLVRQILRHAWLTHSCTFQLNFRWLALSNLAHFGQSPFGNPDSNGNGIPNEFKETTNTTAFIRRLPKFVGLRWQLTHSARPVGWDSVPTKARLTALVGMESQPTDLASGSLI